MKRGPLYLLIFVVLAFVALVVASVVVKNNRADVEPTDSPAIRLLKSDFTTDLSKSNINLDLILSGGPGKDGIPALTNPGFVSWGDERLPEDTRGILLAGETEVKFYPYNILVWHEIVNDTLDGVPVLVTFCPLCGSAIVFDPEIRGRIHEFGVSGLLFESNLLMYDKRTESLWSQARGEAVVGTMTGTKLDILPMQLLTAGEAQELYPNARVLSRVTGYNRTYNIYPYSGYEDSQDLEFPVSVDDRRFGIKELMYVVPYKGVSYALVYAKITEGSEQEHLLSSGETMIVRNVNGEIMVEIDGVAVPGYVEMWFSWATHHQEDGEVLDFTK